MSDDNPSAEEGQKAAGRIQMPKIPPQVTQARRDRKVKYGPTPHDGPTRIRSKNRKSRDKKAASRVSPAERQRLQDAHIDKLDERVRQIANAERRLAAAELQAVAAEEVLSARLATEAEQAWLAELWAAVELRRTELEEYKRLAVAVPASAEHRGVKSYRPVPYKGAASEI